MRRINVIQVISFTLLALMLVAGCAPAPTEVPTQVPTFTPVSRAETATATLVVPSATPPVATATSIAAVTDTPTPTQEAPADTPVPPTDTPVPPTDTSAPPVPTSTATLVSPTNTPLPPTATPLPPTPTQVQIDDWRGAYFDSRSVEGQPDVVRNDRVVDLDLAAGERPAAGIPAENWSARWSRQWTFDEGNYRFQLLVDDGARLWVNDNLLIDAWEDGAPREFAANLYLSGQATIRLEYYNHLGPARVRLNWERVTQYPDWMGTYFGARDLGGLPVFQRNDSAIDFNWGAGSPRDDVPVDNFGVRWTRRIQLSQGGTYRFLVVSDDGARLWVDGRLIIDDWQDGYTTDEATIQLAAGGHDVRLEYYEHLGGALIRLTWSLIPATATPTRTPIPATATPTRTTIPPTATATRTVIPATATATTIPPTPTPTRTPIPPTPTSLPPIIPPTGRSQIVLQPTAGPVGQPISVIGSDWPANAQIEILITRGGAGFNDLTLVGQAVAGPNGRFQTEIVVPPNAGWESQPSVTVVARVANQPGFARAVYNIEGSPAERQVPFDQIPAAADRFALQQPTFLALDSAQAWAAHFGETPPPFNPPVDWQRQYVLGAFLGPQAGQGEARVQSVTVQGDTVVVRLAGAGRRSAPWLGTENVPRTIIRVNRDALGIPGEPVFRFVDAGGQVLASGPAGVAPLSSAAQRLMPPPDVAEGAGTPSAELAPGIQSVPEVAPEEAPAQAEAPMLQQEPGAEAVPAEEILPQAGAGEIGDVRAQVRSVPWQQTAAAWIALLAWGILVVLLIAAIFVAIRWAMRQS